MFCNFHLLAPTFQQSCPSTWGVMIATKYYSSAKCIPYDYFQGIGDAIILPTLCSGTKESQV
jgi:hypothetical protein